MCIRITERYAVCQCVYYVHGIDQCSAAGRAGHSIQERTVLVGYACAAHTGRSMASNAPQTNYYQSTQYTGARLGVLPDYPGTGSSRGSSQGPQQYRY